MGMRSKHSRWMQSYKTQENSFWTVLGFLDSVKTRNLIPYFYVIPFSIDCKNWYLRVSNFQLYIVIIHGNLSLFLLIVNHSWLTCDVRGCINLTYIKFHNASNSGMKMYISLFRARMVCNSYSDYFFRNILLCKCSAYYWTTRFRPFCQRRKWLICQSPNVVVYLWCAGTPLSTVIGFRYSVAGESWYHKP